MTGKWKELARQTKYAMVLVKVLRREIGIEGEAYAAFPLFPVSFLLVVIPAIVALAIFPKLW